MAPAIPDRWLNYKPIGKRIGGTRFIAFKVPLREQVNKDVDADERLDGNILMQSIPNLGMVIDLTNTTRYYNPDFFLKRGIEYSKLMIPGHHTPPPHLVNQFKNIVISFLNKNADNDKLIGVHCTHGVNRTGFLICNYMISELNMQPEEAIANFGMARGHKIERENYLHSLKNLRNANKLDRRPESRYKNTAIIDKQHYVPSLMMSTYNKEFAPWRAQPEPELPPSPKVFDKRSRFERFRCEANAQRQRYAHVGAAAPVQGYTRDSYNISSATNSSNYNSRYVNTSSNHSRGGGNPYPYLHNNHHNQLTHASDSYDTQARNSRPYQNKIYRRKYGSQNHDGISGERNYSRYQLDRRV